MRAGSGQAYYLMCNQPVLVNTSVPTTKLVTAHCSGRLTPCSDGSFGIAKERVAMPSRLVVWKFTVTGDNPASGTRRKK